MSHSSHELTVAEEEPHETEVLLAEIHGVMRAIRGLHEALAAHPDDGGAAEAELLQLIEQRRELARSLGPSLVRWLVSGGQVTLSRSPVPAPAEPEVDPAAPEQPEPVRASAGEPVGQATLEALTRHGITPQWTDGESLELRQRSLRRILRECGVPTRPRTLNQMHQAVEDLASAVAGMDRWRDQPRETQRALMGLVSSVARHLQDELPRPLDGSDRATIDKLFSRMTRWSGDHQPGFVPGLSRANSAQTENWLSDARQWWDSLQRDAHPAGEEPDSAGAALRDLEERMEDGEPDRAALLAMVNAAVSAGVSQSDPRLVALLLPHRDHLKGARGLKTLKGQLRQAERGEDADPADEASGDDPIPAGWPLFHRTRGKKAVIVGGDDRSHAADRIKDAFGFREVEWESGAPRRTAALAERVKAGRSVDMVILLRNFISHKWPDVIVPACKESGVDLVVVDHGYGLTQVRLAMERFLDVEGR